jgi:hypothetical protein
MLGTPLSKLAALAIIGLACSSTLTLDITPASVRTRQLVKRVLVAAALAGTYAVAAALGVVPGMGWYFERQFTEELVGCHITLGTAERLIESPRAFNGDGFSVARYRLPAGMLDCVAATTQEPLAYPRATEDRVGWKVRGWRHPPLSPLDAALSQWSLSAEAADLAPDISAALARPSTWYALLYKGEASTADPNGYIGNVDLFVIDREHGKFYILNLNT